MREITCAEITEAVASLCIRANKILPKNLENRIHECAAAEQSPVGKAVFDDLIANLQAAREEDFPICQDTGMAVVFVELGQDVHITGGTLRQAVDAGVHKGYTEGYLRCSVVGDPLERVNTNDNTPAVLHLELVEGEHVSRRRANASCLWTSIRRETAPAVSASRRRRSFRAAMTC